MIISSPRHTESGNVFFAIFGAIAVVALLGAGLATFVRGPLSSSVTVTRQSIAENQMVIGAQTAIMSASSQVGLGDCDGDMFIEAIPWRDRGALPAPTGGGLIPGSIAAPKRDPWGTDYGYCVWDHGPAIDDAACGGATQNRLQGTNSAAYPVLAIVSAGPDRTFQTTCAEWSTADANVDGDLLDAGDTNLVYKAANSDDVIFSYSYEQAVASSGDLWELKSTDNNVATLAKNLEVTGGASFTSTGDFIGVTGDTVRAYTSGGFLDSDPFRLPDASTFNPTCNAGLTGVLRTNMSGVTGGGGSGSYQDPALVQQSTQVNNTSATIAGSLPTQAVVGNTVIVLLAGESNGTTVFSPSSLTVTDNQGNTYNLAAASSEPTVASPYGSSAHIKNVLIYYARVAISSGTLTVTASETGSPYHFKSIEVLEVSGLAAVNPVDSVAVTNSAASYGSGLTLTASAPTTQTKEFAVAALGGIFDTNGAASVTAGWAPIPGSTNDFFPVYKVTSAVETLTHEWTNGDYNVGALVSFKAASNGGSGSSGVAVTSTFATTQGGNPSATVTTTGSFDSTGYEGIVVFAKHEGASTSISVTDNKGTTFTPLTKQSGAGGDLHGQLFWANLASPGTGHTVTMTTGAARTYREVAVWLVNADGTTIALDDESGHGDNQPVYPYAPELTTSAPATMIGGLGAYNVQNFWPAPGWTEDNQDFDNMKIHRNASYPGVFAPGVSSDNGGDYVFVAAAFRDAAASSTPPVTGSSIALVQKSPLVSVDGYSPTVTLPGPSTAGNTIIVPYSIWSGNVTGVTDNKGNTYTHVAESTQTDITTGIWYANNIVADSTPVQITVTVAGGWRFISTGAMEFYGISDAVNPVERTGTLSQTGGASSTVAISSPKTAPGQLSVAVLGPEFTGSLNFDYSPDWTLAYQTSSPPINYDKWAISSVFKISGTIGAESHTWTHTGPTDSNTDVAGSIATFLPASYTDPADCSSGGGGGGGGGGPLAAPTLIGSTSAAGNATATVAKPSGTVAGHVMIMAVSGDNGQNLPISWPPGWTELEHVSVTEPDGQGWGMAYKIAGGAEPASYTVNYPSTAGVAAVLATYSGVDVTNPIADHGEAHANSGNNPWTVIGPDLITATDNNRIVWFGMIDPSPASSGLSFTPPGGYVEHHDIDGGTTWTHMSMADGVAAAAGATGPINGAADDSSGTIAAATGALAVALTPSGGASNPIAFVQKTAIFSGSAPAYLPITGTAPGNALIVPISIWNGQVSSVTDTQGNTYTQVATSLQNITRTYVYVANNITGGAGTVTVNVTGGEINFGVMEFSGLADFNLVDQTGVSNVAGGSLASVTTSSSTQHEFELAIAVNDAAYSNGNLNYAIGSGWTEAFTQNNAALYSGHSSAYKITSVAEVLTHNWTFGAPIDTYNDNTSSIVTLRASDGSTLSCPAGYTMNNGRCYKFDANGRTWAQAQSLCQADGADMLVINDEAERAYIASQGYYRSWVGYNHSSGSWVWNTPSTWEQTVNRQCAEVSEGDVVSFTAPAGNTINAIMFSSYGTPTGTCGGYALGGCNSPNSISVATAQCNGQSSCSFTASNGTMGGDPCNGTLKHMYVQVRNTSSVWGSGEPNQGSDCAVIWQDSVPGFRLADEPCASTGSSTICEADPVISGGGGGTTAISIGQTAPAATGVDPSVTTTFTTNPTAGNSIVVPISTIGRIYHVSDNAGNSYASIADINEGASRSSIYVATNIKLPPSGNLAITAHFQQYEGGTMRPFEVIGLNPVDFLDRIGQFATTTGGSTTTVTASNVNRQANELAVAVTYPLYSRNPMTPFSIAGGWTQNYVDTNCQGSVCHSSAYKILTATETTSHTWTHQAPVDSSYDDASAVVATLKRNDAAATANPYIVRVSTMGFGNGGSNSLVTSFDTPPAAGNAVIVFITNETNSSNYGALSNGHVTDNQGNTYVRVSGTNTNADWTTNVHMFVAYNVASSGTFTITANYPGGPQTGRIGAVEVTGLEANGADAIGNNYVTYVSSNTVSTTAPTSTADTLAFAVISDYTGRVHTKLDGWSFLYNEPDNGLQAFSVVTKAIDQISTPTHTWQHELTYSSAAIATFRIGTVLGGGGGGGGGGSCSGSGNSLLQMCNGVGQWVDVGGGGSSSPINEGNFDPSTSSVCNTAATGNVRYNTSAVRPEFCNGTTWLPFMTSENGATLMAVPTSAEFMRVYGPVTTPPYAVGSDEYIYIHNTGTQPTAPLSVAITGGLFAINGGSCTSGSTILQPGTNCYIQVSPRANSNGIQSGVLTVQSGTNEITVQLRAVASGFTTCEPGVRGWGGIVLTCVDSTTPEYILQEPGCGTSTSEPACNNDPTNDPIFTMAEGYNNSEELEQDMTNFNWGFTRGDFNSVTTLGYGASSPAAVYCNNLVKGTYTNWYLPSAYEANMFIRPNWNMLGFYWDTAVRYWTSSIDYYDYYGSYTVSYNELGVTNDGQHSDANHSVRCMRRHGVASPGGVIQDMTARRMYPSIYAFVPTYTTSLNTVVTSNSFRVVGINMPLPVTVVGAGTPQFRINGGSWGTSGTISPNQTLQIRVTSPTTVGQERPVQVNIGTADTLTWLVRTQMTKTVKIFVTSTTYNGNLGGLAGADAKCQTRAAAGSQTSGLGGNWYAILAQDDTSAFDRIPWNWNKAERIGATTSAGTSVISLMGGLGTAVNRDENGTTRNNAAVWTGTNNALFISPSDINNSCLNWFDSTPSYYTGYTGRTGQTSTAWIADNTPACDTTARLYCIGPF